MLPRKVKRNHDLSHSSNCALFWAEKVRMTAQENLLSKPHPDGRGIGWMLRFWILGICPYFHAFALASCPTKPSEPPRSATHNLLLLAVSRPGQVTPGRIERAAEKPSRASKVIGLKGF